MNWVLRFKNMLTRDWREKLVAVLLAFLFWFMIKSQTSRPEPSWPPQQGFIMPTPVPAPVPTPIPVPAPAPVPAPTLEAPGL